MIAADDVTVDLHGHIIDGVGQGGGVAIGMPGGSDGPDEVTIEDGTVHQFQYAILVWRANGAHVHKLDVSGIVDIAYSSNDVIEKSSLSGGGITGFEAHGLTIRNNQTSNAGITLGHGSRGVIEGNDIEAGGGYRGVWMSDVSQGTIVRNSVTGAEIGISVDGPFRRSSSEIRSNVVADNAQAGIVLYASEVPNLVERNLVYGNGDGIALVHEPAPDLVTANTVHDNLGDGIAAESGTIVGNDVFANGINGIVLSGGTLSENRVRSNGADGISVPEVSGAFGETSVVGNTTRRNGDDGIDVEAPSTTVTKNRAIRNVDFGIEAISSVIDGGGNRAFGNGNPLQCLNVQCK